MAKQIVSTKILISGGKEITYNVVEDPKGWTPDILTLEEHGLHPKKKYLYVKHSEKKYEAPKSNRPERKAVTNPSKIKPNGKKENRKGK